MLASGAIAPRAGTQRRKLWAVAKLRDVLRRLARKRATRLERATFSLEGCTSGVAAPGPASTYDKADATLVSSLVFPHPDDPDFRLVAERWATLPEAVRARIVGMVEAAATIAPKS